MRTAARRLTNGIRNDFVSYDLLSVRVEWKIFLAYHCFYGLQQQQNQTEQNALNGEEVEK